MKLIYVANARIPTEKAHGIQIMKMLEAFSKSQIRNSKIEAELVLPKRFNPNKENPFEYYGIERIFRIKKLPCLDLIPLDKYIGNLGFWVESLTFSLFLFPYILFKNADIIYTRDKFSLPLALFKKNLIFEAHTFPKNYFLYSCFLRKVKKLVVITQKLKDLFVGQGIGENKVLVASDGVDLAKFDIKETKEDCRKKLDLPQDQKIILYTGHLYEWKGVATLLEAARNFQFPISPDFIEDSRQSRNNFQFVFVGGTEEDIKNFRAKARDLNNVLIVGHRPHSEISLWLKAADVLVLPNSGDEEISKYWTSPLKMFEYMASKRPIVASDLPSIREILNEKNAILVESGNPKKLTEGIKQALQDPAFSDKISRQALGDVKQYTWLNRAKNILWEM